MRISDWSSDVCSSDLITTDSVADHLEEEGGDRIVGVIASLPDDSIGKKFLKDIFGGFELAGIVHPPVTDTFVGEFELSVGNKRVRLVDVGPAHTASDVLVHVRSEEHTSELQSLMRISYAVF